MIIQLDSFEQEGIILDVPAHELPLNAFSAGNNVRLCDESLQRSLGSKEVFAAPSVAPFHIMHWQDISTVFWFYASASNLYITDGTTQRVVTRGTAAASPVTYSGGTHPRWNGGVLGGVPIMNHSNLQSTDYPQSWDTSTSPDEYQDLPNWPVSSPTWLAKVVRVYKNFLIALYMVEDGVTYPTRLRWSAPADPGTVPTDWVPAATNLAGSVPFSASTSPLVDCLPLRDINIVYKEDSVHLMQYVGGTYVFNIRQAFSEFGLLSQRCVKSFFGKHFVMAQGDVVLHNGQEAESIITKKMRRNLFDALSSDNYENAYVVAYPHQEEMWVCIPVNGSGVTSPTRAYIWNWRENAWTIRDIPTMPHIALGIIDESGLGSTFDDLADGAGVGSFDSRTGVFDARTYNPSVLHLLGANQGDTKFIKFDDTNQDDGVDFISYVERTGLAINGLRGGTVTVDPHTIKFIRRLYPKIIADPGCILTIKLGGQENPSAPIFWTTFTFDPNVDTFISCRVQGKLLAYRIESNTAHQWKLQSLGFDLDVVGRQ
jgi:hypothetical protein